MDQFLQAAIDEALTGLGEGGIPIGSVIVRNGEIIGSGHNRRRASSRPGIKVNAWVPSKHLEASSQPNSRSFTVGTYRGNNALFSYTIPASAFVADANTLTITPVSGEKDLDPWLSAGWAYDAIQLDATPAVQ